MRLVILSNRLKVSIIEEEEKILTQSSAGGLVSGLSAYLATFKDQDYLWIGWPGGYSYTRTEEIKNILLKDHNSYPVFINEDMMNLFYNGFCNSTLWPLFHYFPSLTIFDEKLWDVYIEVNKQFADEILKLLNPGDVLWVHDYHFMLLPRLIKEKRNDIPIGFYLHIPFPSFEIFRLLPRKWGKEILNGILGADLIGFHTYDYTQYFLRCVLRILGYHNNLGLINLENKFAQAGSYPIGIDFNKYYFAANDNKVQQERKQIVDETKNMKIIFSVDRQDYTKGIQNRLKGYELFLKNNSQWHEKVVLIMIIVPSRIGVEEYENARNGINQLISTINGAFGNIHWTPVIFQYRAISFEQLTAYYNCSDVGLVTPLRDGMNLVAKEFVASQCNSYGVLILSEMAGASMELGEAIIINPNYSEEIADAILEALEMSEEEKTKKMISMQERLKKNDVVKWADNFVKDTVKIFGNQKKYSTLYLDNNVLKLILARFDYSEKRIMFLDYDGTLVPFANKPNEAVPGKKLSAIIRTLAKIPGNEVVIISGRKKDDLQGWYGSQNVTLVAEHGAWFKLPRERWQLSDKLENNWKPAIKKIMESFKNTLPNSFIEEKDFSLAWHFRNSENSISTLRVKEFVDTIHNMTKPDGIEVLAGNKVIEIKQSSVNKGVIAGQILEHKNYDFILAAGDDSTDEFLFKSLPEQSFTIKIGSGSSFARYYLNSSYEFVMLLERFAVTRQNILQNLLNFKLNMKK